MIIFKKFNPKLLTWIITLVLMLLTIHAEAQTDMRYYFMPKVGDGLTFETSFRPKYIDPNSVEAGWNAGPWQAMDYGLESVMLVALNLTAANHNKLAALPDILAIPNPITANVSALAVSAIQNKLEAANLPSDWVNTTLTYKQVLSRTIRMLQFMQRFHGLFGRLFAGGITLDTRVNQIPAGARNEMKDAAISFGADTSTITGTTTVRQALRIIADQLFPDGVTFGTDQF